MQHTATAHNHHIQTLQKIQMVTEAFTYHALDSISIHGPTTTLLGDRQTQSRRRHLVGTCQHKEEVVRRAMSVLKNPTEFIGF